jgi:farnesyl diphosphate synthase
MLSHHKARVETALAAYLPAAETPPIRLHQAMRYSVLNGGKRLRPALVYATGAALGLGLEQLDAPACAVEFIHAYSLIHDDLPAMDNDDWRRGQPTCHKAFDEATAILAGDALQGLALQILCQPAPGISAEQALTMVRTLAQASGTQGMVGGQALDLAAVASTLDVAQLQTIHHLKTGALIRACIELPLIAAGKDHDAAAATPLRQFADCLGLAFQIQDDILDVAGTMQSLGKQPGGDSKNNKPTYPALLGLAEAQRHLTALRQQALDLLASLPNSGALQQLTTDILRDAAL